MSTCAATTRGITQAGVKRALSLVSHGEVNRYVVKGGKLFMTDIKSRSKWGDSKRWYNAWALLELLEQFPG